ncbi:GNAT family N-acetyltransferase [Gallaecimonas pentaromativorans]|uniref:RimJ/RimL family protein N-acetyltransferase n=1 Tax=Gallaecimonas pentaromativorans TaxID=584787 RepID=A0A3N1PKY9_9GAMM|nr:GNAT family protein [Gallaecimonas pentaromativorans]ROQ28538.1 RimJ/RimL family protein N-acetyltransferase [Gallaecimonas pentaromativorans]
MSFTAPVVLSGQKVQLEPLASEHLDGLQQAAQDGEVWRLWYTRVPHPAEMGAEIARRLALHQAGTMLPFALRRQDNGELCGMTTLMNIDTQNHRVEIGSTWLAASAQSTGINSEAKLLLLGHAFDTLGCIAVEFRTHFMNHKSRAAISRLGAKQDGILRNHQLMPDGSYRDTVVFSIIQSEWPAVRRNLHHLLGRRLEDS